MSIDDFAAKSGAQTPGDSKEDFEAALKRVVEPFFRELQERLPSGKLSFFKDGLDALGRREFAFDLKPGLNISLVYSDGAIQSFCVDYSGPKVVRWAYAPFIKRVSDLTKENIEALASKAIDEARQASEGGIDYFPKRTKSRPG